MRVKVALAPAGFFLADAQVELWIDGRLGYRGSFKSGFTVWATLPPGPHALRTGLALGPIQRDKHWQLAVPEGADDHHLAVTLRYSRLWGNFKRTLLTAITPG